MGFISAWRLNGGMTGMKPRFSTQGAVTLWSPPPPSQYAGNMAKAKRMNKICHE